jgi:hypothetical protein
MSLLSISKSEALNTNGENLAVIAIYFIVTPTLESTSRWYDESNKENQLIQ